MGDYQTPAGLRERVLARVRQGERHRALRYLSVSAAVAVCSLLAIVWSGRLVWAGFSASGSLVYFSLLFSDTGAILPLWREFTLSLAESLPVLALAGALVASMLFLVSLRGFVRGIRPHVAYVRII